MASSFVVVLTTHMFCVLIRMIRQPVAPANFGIALCSCFPWFSKFVRSACFGRSKYSPSFTRESSLQREASKGPLDSSDACSNYDPTPGYLLMLRGAPRDSNALAEAAGGVGLGGGGAEGGGEWSERFFYLSGHFIRYKKHSLNLASVNLKQVRVLPRQVLTLCVSGPVLDFLSVCLVLLMVVKLSARERWSFPCDFRSHQGLLFPKCFANLHFSGFCFLFPF